MTINYLLKNSSKDNKQMVKKGSYIHYHSYLLSIFALSAFIKQSTSLYHNTYLLITYSETT